MTTSLARLKHRLDLLIAEVKRDGETRAVGWAVGIERPEFAASAENLAHYLALRRHDLRPLQRSLMALGLSSLGRLESRVMPTLEAVTATLAALCDQQPDERPSTRQFFAGEQILQHRSLEIFGSPATHRRTALLSLARPKPRMIRSSCFGSRTAASKRSGSIVLTTTPSTGNA